MMHSNNFVLAVKDSNSKILREIAGKVYLPFNSEYSIYLKNNNNVRSCCSVSIDGTDVLGTELILNAFDSIDLERFLVNGDIRQGNRFRFVSLSDNRVQDPSNPENGLIEVKFWKEIQTVYFRSPIIVNQWPQPIYPSTIYYCNNGIGASTGTSVKSTDNLTFTSNYGNQVLCSAQNYSVGQPGATVEGSLSHQSFTSVSFSGKDGVATIIRLQLMGRNEPITVEKTRHIYCGECGKSNPYNNKFCGRCGKRLQKIIKD
jgi:hypothetical protein